MSTSNNPWYFTRLGLWASVLIFPPVGLVLLWMRPQTRLPWKLLGSVVVAGIGMAHLLLFYGLRMEPDGTGIMPMFSFKDPASQQQQLEQHRAAQKAAEPAQTAAPATVEAAAPQASAHIASAYWADFRGPERQGHYEQKPILTVWPAQGLQRLWKQPAGGGYASFTIAEGMAFTIEQRRNQEVVAAYEVPTGREKWTNAWTANFQEGMGGDGPRATPVWDGGRVYAQGAEGELRCIDATSGKTIWNVNILRDNGASNIQWGMANAPLVVDGKVIVLPGGSGGKSVVAYDKITGKRVWSALDDQASYTSPMLVTLAGKRQLLIVTAKRAAGLTVEEGKLLWEYPWTTEFDINCAQPIIVAPNRFFISAGYGHGAAVVELSGQGDRFQPRTVWQNTRMKNKFNSSVLYQGHIYGLDENILACVNAETGDQKWKGGRYGYGQLLLASGHLVVLSESGDVALVKASPERHQEVAQFSAIEGKTWNHPAISDGLLLVRNTTEMACFRIGR
ncbi:MAG: PQQ-like beta-propeller repeat protein [Acidobacteriia bacterium]|nr:PQQ-like beta-propeller repeat protein [Terriglobia bacterium]